MRLGGPDFCYQVFSTRASYGHGNWALIYSRKECGTTQLTLLIDGLTRLNAGKMYVAEMHRKNKKGKYVNRLSVSKNV